MHRARKRSVAAAAIALASVLTAPAAWAFHAGSTFDKPPGAGGTDGIYYTGSPAEHGWKCTLCHTNPPGKISLHINQPELFSGGDTFVYEPGKLYQFDVDLVGEHAGLTSTKSNYNSLVVQILDQNQAPIGAVLYAEADFYSGFAPTTIASSGTQPNTTHWTFKWIAPGATDGAGGGAPGPVTMYFAVIDGNGADVGSGGTLTDPFGDDFFSVEVHIEQGPAGMMGRRDAHAAPRARVAAAASPRAREAGPLYPPVIASMFGMIAAAFVLRRRRR